MGWRWWYRFVRLYGNGRIQSAIKVAVFKLHLRPGKGVYLSPKMWF
jgi:hypothetical protein